MPSKKRPSVPIVPGQPRHYDPSLGKLALTNLAPRLKALSTDEVLSTRLDIDTAALAALATYARATAPALRSRFQKQHDVGEFDIAHLDNLEDLAFAALYAHAEASSSLTSDNGVKLPAVLVERAIEIAERMQALCEYHFRDDPEIAPELDLLLPGNGRRDLASDLNRYARIYELRADTVALDKKHYRDTDVEEARNIAGLILNSLSAGTPSKTRTSQDTLARAWTLLWQSYEEVRTVGLFFLRNNPDKHRFFPSLFVAAKTIPASRKRTKTLGTNHANPSAHD